MVLKVVVYLVGLKYGQLDVVMFPEFVFLELWEKSSRQALLPSSKHPPPRSPPSPHANALPGRSQKE
jgi:hypothetical protein